MITSKPIYISSMLQRVAQGLFIVMITSALPAQAQLVFDVNTLSDFDDFIIGDGICMTVAGECSFRAAIQEANAHPNGAALDEITFYNIPVVNGKSRINVNLPGLPDITDGVIIRGGTSGAGLTRIDGSSSSLNYDGLYIDEGADGTIIRGLVVGNFSSVGICINADDVKIQYSYIGTNPGGANLGNDIAGIYALNPVDNLVIGGSVEKGNVIGHNGLTGIDIHAGENARIAGNLIGVCEDGSNCANISTGIRIESEYAVIGGPSTDYANTIGYNGTGIFLFDASFATVQNNFIGITEHGDPVGNTINGIVISNPADAAYSTIIGHSIADDIDGAPSLRNTIAYNGLKGIAVTDNDLMAVTIRGNEIYDNGWEGIDINFDGFSPNDVGDPDGAANKTQNFPELLGMAYNEVRDAITLEYQVDTDLASASYPLTVDVYIADTTTSSEGKTHVGSSIYTAPGTIGEAQIELEDIDYIDEDVFVATATDSDGNTSEFSLASASLGTVVSAAYPAYFPLKNDGGASGVDLPGTHLLYPAYPNPFNPSTTFSLAVKEPGPVQISLHDALGRRIATLHRGELKAGLIHTFTIDGGKLATGTYLLRIAGSGFIETQQLVLVK